MTKSAKLRAAMQATPGATLDELHAATKLDRNFISTVCSHWVKAGKVSGNRVDGFTLRDDLPPRLSGNRAALREAGRKGKGKGTQARRARPVVTPAGEVRTSGYEWLLSSLPIEQFLGFLRGNAMMALSAPGGIESYRAAANYVTGLIEIEGARRG